MSVEVKIRRARGSEGKTRPTCPAFAGVLAVCWLALCSHGLRAQEVVRLAPIVATTSDRLSQLGDVTDVATVGGRLYILDAKSNRILITDQTLQFLGSFGRRGSGPGEFRDPVAIGVLSDGRIAVLDRALRRVTLLTISKSESTPLLHATMPIKMPAEGMCVLPAGRLLIYGYSTGNRLHIVGLDGTTQRSFAPARAGYSPMALELLAYGKIACDPMRDEVLVSSRFLPIVEAFRISSGQLTWVDNLRPFRALAVADRGNAVTISSGRAGFSLISNILILGPYRVFQTIYESRRDHPEVDTVATYVHSDRTKCWAPIGFDTPLLFRLDGLRALSVEENDRLELAITTNRLSIDENTTSAASRVDLRTCSRGSRRRE